MTKDTDATEQMIREAFRAGWLVNAVPPDEHEAGADYARACEEADWQEWKQAQEAARAGPKNSDADRGAAAAGAFVRGDAAPGQKSPRRGSHEL